MLVPTGRRYTARVQSEFVRKCTCERCRNPFSYRFNVSGSGTGRSPLWLRNEAASDDAERAANQAMQKNAKKAYPPVPCPSCGHFQADMVKYYKRTRLQRSMKFLRLLLLVVLVFATIEALDQGLHSVLGSGLFWIAFLIPCSLIGLVLFVRARAMPTA